jgi:microcystin-dependent protein
MWSTTASRDAINLDIALRKIVISPLYFTASFRSLKLRLFSSFLGCRATGNVCVVALLLATGQMTLLFGDTVTGTTGGNQALDNRQPYLAMSYMIAVSGTPPDNAASGPTGTQPPNRTQPFLGEIKPIPFYFGPSGWMLCEGQSLATADHTALFNLIGYTFGGSGANFNLPDLRNRVPIGAGQGQGLPNYLLGNFVGTSYPVLSVANLPAHTHTFSGGNSQPTGTGAPLDNRQPSLALHFLIAANGEIMIASWAHEPTGWAHCDGRLLNATTFSYLYSNIGTAYGGNGSPSFALPDLRGRTVMGDDPGSSRPVGLAHGVSQNVLNNAAIPAHTHTITGGNTGSTGGTGDTANNFQPSLVMRWLMSFSGTSPSGDPNAPPPTFPMLSEIRIIAGATADGLPVNNWATLYGDLLPLSMHQTLFGVIGQTYGGDGKDTFALPDLRSRVDIGNDDSELMLGEASGSELLFISVPQLAAHSHSLLQLQITAIQHFSDGSAQVFLSGTVGQTCQVDKSDDLVTWSNLGSVQFNTSSGNIPDSNPGQVGKRFYKAYFP